MKFISESNYEIMESYIDKAGPCRLKTNKNYESRQTAVASSVKEKFNQARY